MKKALPLIAFLIITCQPAQIYEKPVSLESITAVQESKVRRNHRIIEEYINSKLVKPYIREIKTKYSFLASLVNFDEMEKETINLHHTAIELASGEKIDIKEDYAAEWADNWAEFLKPMIQKGTGNKFSEIAGSVYSEQDFRTGIEKQIKSSQKFREAVGSKKNIFQRVFLLKTGPIIDNHYKCLEYKETRTNP